MKKYLLKLLFLGIFTLIFEATINAQEQKSTATKIINTAGKATVIVVGESAKATYELSKFAGKKVVKPLAKTLIVKAAPKTAGFMLKLSGKAIKKGIPVGKKLFVTYLKTRLSL